jgi:hypothetical protein
MIGSGIGNNDQQNFQAWYVNILESLYDNRAAGIAVLMISTPLLERYLRQKNGRSPRNVSMTSRHLLSRD